jgi:hypothetical protein
MLLFIDKVKVRLKQFELLEFLHMTAHCLCIRAASAR